MVYQFPQAVERWRSLVEEYFPPHLVNKALWTIEKESSGRPDAYGGGATGLFQIQALPGRPSAESFKDPRTNVQYAAQVLGAAQGNFKPWGENNLYEGKPFGAFGYNDYPGDEAFGTAPVNGRAAAPQLTWANAPITGKFGPTDEVRDGGYTDPVTGEYHPHFNKGYDFGIPAGTPIEAAVGGEVIAVGRQNDGWGVSIKIRDAEGNTHNYGHLGDFNVQVGDRVNAGQLIGVSGNSADPIPGTDMVTSTGDHLSYDVWDANGRYLEPSRFLSGGGQMAQDLPFSQQDYQTKLARYLYLDKLLATYDPYENPIENYESLLQEWGQLGAEITSYDAAMAEGGTGIDDEIARARYNWETDPRRIDAENQAAKWARQQQINQQALGSTQNDLAEQRATAGAASAETQAYTSSSHFTQPMGFRVGATDLPTEEELFAKNIARASKDLPEVTPIPYAPALSAFGAPRAPGAPSTGSGASTPGQSFGTIPTRSDIAGVLKPKVQTMPGGTQVTTYPDGSRIGAGSWADDMPPPSQPSAGQRLFDAAGTVRNAVANAITPGVGAFGARSIFTPPQQQAGFSSKPGSGLMNQGRRFVGSLFGRF